MCTLSFIPLSNSSESFILTSNRDEAADRKTIPPKIYKENACTLLYPKDAVAGGTWIGASSKKRLITLMNGAEKAHVSKDSYRLSRGVVVKDFLTADDVLHRLETYVFEEIEPFTMVIVSWKAGLELYELIWNGTKVLFKKLKTQPHIWSASMTYSQDMKEKRHQWFYDFLERENWQDNPKKKLWDFHHSAGAEDKDLGFIIDRGKLKTTSITQFSLENTKKTMRFDNLITQEESLVSF